MSRLTIWNQHRYSRKYDGHIFRYLTYADFITLIGDSGITDKELADAPRINAHMLMGDESDEIKEGLKKMDELAQKIPVEKIWAACIVDMDEKEAIDYICKIPRTKELQNELEHMLTILADLSAPNIDMDNTSMQTMLKMTTIGIPWITIDTMTWQQGLIYLPYLIQVAEERKKMQESLNVDINNCRR